MQTFICQNDIKNYLRGFLVPNNPVEKERNDCAPIPDELRPGIQFCVDKIEAFPADDCHNVRIIETYVHKPPDETVLDVVDTGTGVVLRREQIEDTEAMKRIRAQEVNGKQGEVAGGGNNG